TTMSITARQTRTAATVWRPPNILMTRRCNGQSEKESTVAQTIADTNGQRTRRQPSSRTSRIPRAIFFSRVDPEWVIGCPRLPSKSCGGEPPRLASESGVSTSEPRQALLASGCSPSLSRPPQQPPFSPAQALDQPSWSQTDASP